MHQRRQQTASAAPMSSRDRRIARCTRESCTTVFANTLCSVLLGLLLITAVVLWLSLHPHRCSACTHTAPDSTSPPSPSPVALTWTPALPAPTFPSMSLIATPTATSTSTMMSCTPLFTSMMRSWPPGRPSQPAGTSQTRPPTPSHASSTSSAPRPPIPPGRPSPLPSMPGAFCSAYISSRPSVSGWATLSTLAARRCTSAVTYSSATTATYCRSLSEPPTTDTCDGFWSS
jgi:hypothetical protein